MQRYDNYKDSEVQWLGQVPSHWEVKQLFAGCYEHYISNANIHHQNLLSLSYGKIKRKSIDSDTGLLPKSFDTYQVVEKGNIVLRMTDLQNDQRSLRTGLVKEEGIVTSAYIALGCRENTNPAYAHYLLHSYDVCKVFYGMGGGVRQGLNYNELRKLPFLLPPLPEQQAIAAYLDERTGEIDRAIEREQRMIALLQERKQIVIQRAATRGLDPNAPTKESGVEWIGEVPEHWEVEPFSRHFTFGRGLTITKADLVEDGVAVINYGQVHSKSNNGTTITKDLIRYVPTEYLASNKDNLLLPNDFVFADTSEDIAGSGNFALNDYKGKIFAGYHTLVARPIDLYCAKYYAYLFMSKSWKSQVQSLVNGVKVYSIGRGILKKSFILFPPKEEQEAIASYLDEQTGAIDGAIERRRRMIALLQERRQIMISDAVRGKVRI